MKRVQEFQRQIVNAGVIDPRGQHHVFKEGMHGQKLDFKIAEENEGLFNQWVELTADFIASRYRPRPDLLVGVPRGGTKLAIATAKKLELQYSAFTTEKEIFDDGQTGSIHLSDLSARIMRIINPDFVLVLDDVATTGSSAASLAAQCLAEGAQNVEVLYTWQRQQKLERLMRLGIAHQTIIFEPLETYTGEDCRDGGFCEQGWEVIPYGQTLAEVA